MTYTEWRNSHNKKVEGLLNKLSKYSDKEIIDYFDYDNMRVNEPNFCALYKSNIKCHDIENLNCYLCACPHFKCSDTPLEIRATDKVYSICTINSRFAKVFTIDGNTHCDCSSCTIPHSKKYALKYLDRNIEDSYSLLDLIRNWQLTDIFKRVKFLWS